MLWLTVFVFIGLLLALVLVHELGHFVIAKKAGCRVEEFAFGFPPRLWSWQKGETRYSFNLLPLGGYVKIEGEDMQSPDPGPRSFASKSATWRIAILAAGVIMNVLLAWVLLSVQAGIGVPELVTEENKGVLRDLRSFIVAVDPGSPAETAGLKELDRVVHMAGVFDPTVTEIQRIVAEHSGAELLLEVERQGVHHDITVTPRVDPPPGEGAMGVALQATGLKTEAWWRAPVVGLRRTGMMLVAIVTQFWLAVQRLAMEGTVGEALTGPIGIAVYTNEVTTLGASYVLEFAALISLNLAIINILPIPALDGGRILFVLMEKLFGRRIPGRVEQISHMTGFALLILLMVVITWRDISRFL